MTVNSTIGNLNEELSPSSNDYLVVEDSGGLEAKKVQISNLPTTPAPVDSVNGQTGVVVLDTGDIAEATDKNYVTDAQSTKIDNAIEQGSNTLTEDLVLDGNDVIVNNGKIGVGTTSPASPVHIKQNDAEIGAWGGFTLEQEGTGDVLFHALLTGVKRWVFGIDNSDSDKFKISDSLDLGTNTKMSIDTAGNLEATTFNGVALKDNGTTSEYLRGDGTYGAAGGGSSSELTMTETLGETVSAGDALAYNFGYTETVDSYDTTASLSSSVWNIWQSASRDKAGQSITLTDNEYIDKIKVGLIIGTGSPTGNLTAKIYSSQDDSSLLATSNNTIDASTITGTGTYYEFTFDKESIGTGVKYFMIESDTTDGSNYVSVTGQTNNPYSDGAMFYVSDSNSWGTISGYDVSMKLDTSTLDYDGKLYKADANDSARDELIGFAKDAGVLDDDIEVTIGGINSNQSSLTKGAKYYMSDTAGEISTAPWTQSVYVGKANSTTSIIVNTLGS